MSKKDKEIFDEESYFKSKQAMGKELHNRREIINELYKDKYNSGKELEKLQARIYKALDFIYENAYSEDRKELVDDLWNEIPELVAILKGEDK